MQEMKALVEAAQKETHEANLRCKVFEDALELHAAELGLEGKGAALAELAKLRGEAAANAKEAQAQVRAVG